ncbi:MAG: flavodoxin family protein [Ruminococcaceae bacterium]|nr:flavodoxin family protein [Oscillospiraceae bacterium]
MKVLMLNGSPKANGNTARVLSEMQAIFEKEGVEVDYVQVGHLAVRGCTSCGACYKEGHCVIEDDIVNELAGKLAECDGMVVGSPVYYAAPNGTLVTVLNRLFYSAHFDKRMKVGAAMVVARRGGTTAAFDQLNKYFTISGMPVVSGQYWNMAHGARPGEVEQDGEGLQNARTVAANMVFLMRSIALGKERYGLPVREKGVWTNFIR